MCKTCGLEKELSDFHKDKRNKDGHRNFCKVCSKAKSNKWNKENIPTNRKRASDWYYDNKDYKEFRDKKNAYMREYMKTYEKSESLRIRGLLSDRINSALRWLHKSKSTMELLGCSIEYLKEHLEKQFQDGMTWENRGQFGWHIDHIIPCAAFDLNNPEEQKKCFHYTNLQPLWATDNHRKGANLPTQDP